MRDRDRGRERGARYMMKGPEKQGRRVRSMEMEGRLGIAFS